MKIQGMYASVATPFDHAGALYRVKIQHNFEKWSRTSLAGFIVGSLAGEGPLLGFQEKVEMLSIAAPHIPEGRTIIADISTISSSVVSNAMPACLFDLVCLGFIVVFYLYW